MVRPCCPQEAFANRPFPARAGEQLAPSSARLAEMHFAVPVADAELLEPLMMPALAVALAIYPPSLQETLCPRARKPVESDSPAASSVSSSSRGSPRRLAHRIRTATESTNTAGPIHPRVPKVPHSRPAGRLSDNGEPRFRHSLGHVGHRSHGSVSNRTNFTVCDGWAARPHTVIGRQPSASIRCKCCF